MASDELQPRAAAVRHFTRFYTRCMGVLHERLLDSPFTVPEARIVYEIAHDECATAASLSRALGLDPSYLSRLLKGLEKRGLVVRRALESDRRAQLLALSADGRAAFALVDSRSQAEVETLLAPLPGPDQRALVDAMATIERLLANDAQRTAGYLLRPHRPGDVGWIVRSHAVLYATEYGWDGSFEALVAEIGAHFLKHFDAQREHCWIAEIEGQNVGSAIVMTQSETVAKLRLVLVEARARGLGIGKRLVDESIHFARERGYTSMTLWTNDVLTAARHIYINAGFKLVAEERHHSFGKDLVGQNWELQLL